MIDPKKSFSREAALYQALFKSAKVTLAKTGVLAQSKANMLLTLFQSLKEQNADALTHQFGNPARDAFASTGTFLRVLHRTTLSPDNISPLPNHSGSQTSTILQMSGRSRLS